MSAKGKEHSVTPPPTEDERSHDVRPSSPESASQSKPKAAKSIRGSVPVTKVDGRKDQKKNRPTAHKSGRGKGVKKHSDGDVAKGAKDSADKAEGAKIAFAELRSAKEDLEEEVEGLRIRAAVADKLEAREAESRSDAIARARDNLRHFHFSFDGTEQFLIPLHPLWQFLTVAFLISIPVAVVCWVLLIGYDEVWSIVFSTGVGRLWAGCVFGGWIITLVLWLWISAEQYVGFRHHVRFHRLLPELDPVSVRPDAHAQLEMKHPNPLNFEAQFYTERWYRWEALGEIPGGRLMTDALRSLGLIDELGARTTYPVAWMERYAHLSGEMFAQLAIPANLPLSPSMASVWERIQTYARHIQAVNFDKYAALLGNNVPQETTLAVYYAYRQQLERAGVVGNYVGIHPFPAPPPL
jgi:hypothetical protein